jgi:hypothetical protein
MSKLLSENVLSACCNLVPKAISRPWPFLKCIAAKFVDDKVRKRNVSQGLRSLKGRYSEERCFIMGSGPSLNRMDLELLREEYVWAVNKCYLLFDRINWRPSFYVAVDTRVVPDIAREINHLIRNLSETTFFFPLQFREQWVLRSGTNVYWYREVPLDETNLPDGVFTRDASEWVSSSRTVAIAALQLAVYLGFNPIYLIGCDTSYAVSSSVRTEGNDPDRFISTKDNDPDHFDPRYFGQGSKWHKPHVGRMLFHYEQARRVCHSLGVNVYNATVGGKLEVFPRVDYIELF